MQDPVASYRPSSEAQLVEAAIRGALTSIGSRSNRRTSRRRQRRESGYSSTGSGATSGSQGAALPPTSASADNQGVVIPPRQTVNRRESDSPVINVTAVSQTSPVVITGARTVVRHLSRMAGNVEDTRNLRNNSSRFYFGSPNVTRLTLSRASYVAFRAAVWAEGEHPWLTSALDAVNYSGRTLRNLVDYVGDVCEDHRVVLHNHRTCGICAKGEVQVRCQEELNGAILVDEGLLAYLRTYTSMRTRNHNLMTTILSRCKTYQREYGMSDYCLSAVIPGTAMYAYMVSPYETRVLSLAETYLHRDTARQMGQTIRNAPYSGYWEAISRGGWKGFWRHARSGSTVVGRQ